MREELALQRCLLDDAIEAYDYAVEQASGLKLPQQQHAKIVAGGLVAQAIERVQQTALANLKIASARVMLMPDVAELIERLIGTVDLELATRAGNLRMAGVDPDQFMSELALKLREVSRIESSTPMFESGPAQAEAEAAAMDATVPAREDIA